MKWKFWPFFLNIFNDLAILVNILSENISKWISVNCRHFEIRLTQCAALISNILSCNKGYGCSAKAPGWSRLLKNCVHKKRKTFCLEMDFTSYRNSRHVLFFGSKAAASSAKLCKIGSYLKMFLAWGCFSSRVWWPD